MMAASNPFYKPQMRQESAKLVEVDVCIGAAAQDFRKQLAVIRQKFVPLFMFPYSVSANDEFTGRRALFPADPAERLVERSRWRGEKFENGVNSFLCVLNSGHPQRKEYTMKKSETNRFRGCA